MPGSAPIAEANVQITMDNKAVNAEVNALQKKLGPMVQTGTKGTDALNQGSLLAAGGMRGLHGSLDPTTAGMFRMERAATMLQHSLGQGEISGRGMMHMLKLLGPVGIAVGAVVGTTLAGFKLANIFSDMQGMREAATRASDKMADWWWRNFESTSKERRDAAFSKIFAENLQKQFTVKLNIKMAQPIEAFYGRDRAKGETDYHNKLQKEQNEITEEMAERTGKNVAQLKLTHAERDAKAAQKHAVEDNAVMLQAKQETEKKAGSLQEAADRRRAYLDRQMAGGYGGKSEKDAAEQYKTDLDEYQALGKSKQTIENERLSKLDELAAQELANKNAVADADYNLSQARSGVNKDEFDEKKKQNEDMLQYAEDAMRHPEAERGLKVTDADFKGKQDALKDEERLAMASAQTQGRNTLTVKATFAARALALTQERVQAEASAEKEAIEQIEFAHQAAQAIIDERLQKLAGSKNAGDLDEVRKLEHDKIELSRNAQDEKDALKEKEIANVNAVRDAQTEAAIAAMEAHRQESAHVSSGAASIWGAAMGATTAVPVPPKDPTDEEIKKQTQLQKQTVDVLHDVVAAVRTHGMSVWLPGV